MSSSNTLKTINKIRILSKNRPPVTRVDYNNFLRDNGGVRRPYSALIGKKSVSAKIGGRIFEIHEKFTSSASNQAHQIESDLKISALCSVFLVSTAAFVINENARSQNEYETGTSPATFCDVSKTIPGYSNHFSNNSSKESKSQPKNVMLHRRRSLRARHLGEKYKIDWNNCLGEGAYAQVFPARLLTGEKVAIKRIAKKYTDSSAFRTETNALLRIYDNGGHPYISGLRDMYEDDDYYYLVMDLVSGGEMFDHLINYGAYSEADSSRLIQEIASALAFLHGVGVVHADLKPENLLLCSKMKSAGTIKIIDFGCANIFNDNFHDYTDEAQLCEEARDRKDSFSIGTTAYWPPERFKGACVDSASDMWAVGIILYIMLVGCHPFDITGTSSDDDIAKRIKKDPSPPNGELTEHLTPSAHDLIKKLLEPDPTKRLTAQEMLRHPWVRGETATTSVIVGSDKKLSRFNEMRHKIETGIFAMLVSHGHKNAVLSEAKVDKKSRDNVNIMKKAFESFDIEGKGFLSPNDFARVIGSVTDEGLSSNETRDLESTLRELSAHIQDTDHAGISLSNFSQLFCRLKHEHYPRGHVIFNAGEEGDAMYFLNGGKVEIKTRKGQLVALLRQGDFFGEGSLLQENKRRFTTAKCASPVDVIKISRKDFDRYIASSDLTRQDLKVKWMARSLTYAKQLIRLQKNVKNREFKKGDIIYAEGDIGKSMYLVNEQDGGVLDVTHDGVKVHSYHGGDSFGESSLLFSRPRSSTVTCVSEKCLVREMLGSDFLSVVKSSPEAAASLLDMCRKRYFKKAVKKINRDKKRDFEEQDLVAAFNDADVNGDGRLALDEIRNIMTKMDPNFPESEIIALMKFLDVDETGAVTLAEFKRMFRVFERMEKH